MAPNRKSSRRPCAGTGGSLSAAFAVVTESSDQLQSTQSTADSELQGLQPADSHPSSQHPGSASSAAIMLDNENAQNDNAEAMTTRSMVDAASAEYEIEKLEIEVYHFIQLSMEEKQKSEALSGELASTKQQKHDVEQQVQQLQVELDQARIGAQQNEIMSAGLQQTVTTLNASIDELRNTGQQHEADLENFREMVEQRTNTVRELEGRLDAAETELVRKKQAETEIRQKLDKMKKDLKTQKLSNAKLQQTLRQAQEQRDNMRDSNISTKAKLSETEQTVETLSDLVKRKNSELQEVNKAATEQTWKLERDVDRKEDELKTLRTAKAVLISENGELKCALEDSSRNTLVASEVGEMKIFRLEQEKKALQRELETEREKFQQEKKDVYELTKKLQQHYRRRVRNVAICVDLSGSVSASGLTGGVKRFYAHLLNHLKRAAGKTYVMTVVHGPDNRERVKSEFGSPWTAHEHALKCEETAGSEAYVACLRRIKETTISTGLFLTDLQVVLIGDGYAYGDEPTDTESLCQDFSSSDTPVSIHSVVVQEGTGTGKPKPSPVREWLSHGTEWRTWDYSSRTEGNEIYWGQENPLPDLGGLLL